MKETYGNIRSDSSDDDDWTDMNLKKVKRRGESKSTVMASLQNTQTIQDGENTKQSQRKPEGEVLPKQEKLPDTRTLHNLESEGADHTMKAYYMRKKLTTSRPGCFGREVSQVLFCSSRCLFSKFCWFRKYYILLPKMQESSTKNKNATIFLLTPIP